MPVSIVVLMVFTAALLLVCTTLRRYAVVCGHPPMLHRYYLYVMGILVVLPLLKLETYSFSGRWMVICLAIIVPVSFGLTDRLVIALFTWMESRWSGGGHE